MYASDLHTLATRTDHLDGTGVNADLEEALTAFTGFALALGMSNASTALAAAYAAVGLAPGDEVIAPSLTASETIAPLLRRGCTVVLADTLADSLTINPEEVERLVTPRTKGLVGVDLAGWPHDTNALRRIADKHGLVYVADLAQGFSARNNGDHSGRAAHAAVLSLNAQKQLPAGEGGVLLTNDEALYQRVLRETQHPHRQARELGIERVNYFSANGRLSALAASTAITNLPPAINRIHEQRHQAAELITLLNATGLVDPIMIPDGCEPTFPYLTATWRNTPQPTALLTLLHDAGHDARLRNLPLHPLHTLPQVQGEFARHVRTPEALPNTEKAARRVCIHVGGTP
jgi:perosamine synthetase